MLHISTFHLILLDKTKFLLFQKINQFNLFKI